MKAIPGFPGYFITANSEVWSSKSHKWLKPRLTKGYLRVALYKGSRKNYKNLCIHTLMLETFVGKRKPSQVCRHLDGNKLNNKLSNLCWGSVKENIADSLKHGTHDSLKRKGENHPLHKLTKKDVINIIHLWNTKLFRQREIASFYGIARQTVEGIVNKRRWKHL